MSVCVLHLATDLDLVFTASTKAGVNVADMAEAPAVAGLVASITSLVKLTTKVVSRLHDFTSKISQASELSRSLKNSLPLLTATLQHIQTQAKAARLHDDVTNCKLLLTTLLSKH